MKVAVSAAGALRRLVEFRDKVEVEAERLDHAVARISEMYPTLQAALFDPQGRIRSCYRLFVNGEMVPVSETGRALQDNDQIDILTAVAGG